MLRFDPVKLEEANRILGAYLDQVLIVPGGSVLPRELLPPVQLSYRGELIRTQLDPTGSHIVLPKTALRFGGMNEDAIAQLLRFSANLTRRPLAWWERVVLYREPIEVLKTTSYPDPYKTACVLCGAQGASLDWWSDKIRQGPCCFYGRCLEGKQ
jgi:hypothetical protein